MKTTEVSTFTNLFTIIISC